MMNPEIENAMRSVARKCRNEIIEKVTGKPRAEHDKIFTEVLAKHSKAIKVLPPKKFSATMWLSYFVRQINRECKN